jgi:hypothetical protein
MAQHYITEREFKSALAEFLREADVPQNIKDEVERVQMLLATPGEWQAAQHQPPDSPQDDTSDAPSD